MAVSAQTLRAGAQAVERLSKPAVWPLFVALVFAAFLAVQLVWARQDRIEERAAAAAREAASSAKDAAYLEALRRIARNQDRLAMKLGFASEVQ